MKSNMRVILYALAAGLIFILWQRWQLANMPQNPTAQIQIDPSSSDAGVPSAGASNTSMNAPVAAHANAQEQFVRVRTDVLDVLISTRGATLMQADLLKYPVSLKDDQALALIRQNNPNRMQMTSGMVSAVRDEASPTHTALWQSTQNEYVLAKGQDSLTVPFTWQNEQGLSVSKTFTFHRGKYEFELLQQLDNSSANTWQGIAYNQIAFGKAQGSQGLSNIATFTGAVLSSADNRYEKIKLSDIADTKKAAKSVNSTDGWVAMIQHYFIAALVPKNSVPHVLYTQYNPNNGDHIVGVKSEVLSIPAGSRYEFSSSAYVGPKIVKDLDQVAPYLDKTVDYGMLFMISEFMFKIMELIHKVIGNWGWAIVVMTLLIKLLFFVPSAWAYKSMAKMRALQPEMTRLRELYGNDRQAMSQEIMKLYKKEQVNPASGCLPMLLQIPFFIAFYYMLAESVELRHAPWMGWIQDLSAMDPYFILPIINMGLMFLQQKLNPPPADPMQQKVMLMMPLIFGFMFMWFPSGLVLYWTVSNAFGIVQQWLMNKRYGESHKALQNHHAKQSS